MRNGVERIAEAIRAKLLGEEPKSEPGESPCGSCPLEGCCEMVQCDAKAAERP